MSIAVSRHLLKISIKTRWKELKGTQQVLAFMKKPSPAAVSAAVTAQLRHSHQF